MSAPKSPQVEVHGYVTCPFAWRVRLAAHEKGVHFSWIPCDVDAPDERAARHNPDEHSPLLWHDGFALLESEIIMQYLDEAFSGTRPLMPEDPRDRAELRLLAIHLRGLDAHTEPARPIARKKTAPALATLEQELASKLYLHGDEPGHVDFMGWPFLANLAVRDLIDAHATPAVMAYVRRLGARASSRETAPPWAQALR